MDKATAQTRAFEVTHRLVLSIAVPMTLGYLTTPLLGLTDTAVVGHLGDPASLGGLAIGALLFDLLYGSLSFLRTAPRAWWHRPLVVAMNANNRPCSGALSSVHWGLGC